MKKVLSSLAIMNWIVSLCFAPADAAAADNGTSTFDVAMTLLYSSLDGYFVVENPPDSGLTPWQVIDITRVGPVLFLFSDTGLTTGFVSAASIPRMRIPRVIFNLDGILYLGYIDFTEDSDGYAFPLISGANRENGKTFRAAKAASLTVAVSPKDSGSVSGESAAEVNDDIASFYEISCGSDCEALARWNEDQQFTLTATPDNGYTFKHWEVNGTTFTDNPVTITMDRYPTSNLTSGYGRPRLKDLDKTVTAVFETSDDSTPPAAGGEFTCEVVSPADGDIVNVADYDQQYRARVYKDGVDITDELTWTTDKQRANGLFYVKNYDGEWICLGTCRGSSLQDDGTVGITTNAWVDGSEPVESQVKFEFKIWYDSNWYDVDEYGEPVEGSCTVDITMCADYSGGSCDGAP